MYDFSNKHFIVQMNLLSFFLNQSFDIIDQYEIITKRRFMINMLPAIANFRCSFRNLITSVNAEILLLPLNSLFTDD